MSARGFVRDYEVKYIKKNGDIVILSTTSHYVYDDKDKIIGVEGIIQDVTGKKRLEDSLLLEKRKLVARRINRADMRESFLSLTAAGRTIYEELAPHALDFARRLTDILTPDDREAFHRALQQITERSAELVAEAIKQDGAGMRDMGKM